MSEQTVPVTRTEDEIRATVLTLIIEMAPNQDTEVTSATHLVQDLGYHSLALMEMAFAVEDEFDLDPIDEETARKISSVGAVQELVVQRVNERDAK